MTGILSRGSKFNFIFTMFRLLLLGRRDFVLGLGGHLVHLGVHVVSIRQRHIYKGCPVRLYFAAGTDIFFSCASPLRYLAGN